MFRRSFLAVLGLSYFACVNNKANAIAGLPVVDTDERGLILNVDEIFGNLDFGEIDPITIPCPLLADDVQQMRVMRAWWAMQDRVVKVVQTTHERYGVEFTHAFIFDFQKYPGYERT